MKILKRIVLVLFILGAIGAGVGYYLFNKPHQSIADAKAAFTTEAAKLVEEFEADETKANTTYLGKVIEVNGIVSDQSTDEKGIVNIVLQGGDLAGVGCQFAKNVSPKDITVKKGQKVSIKGVCTGMLMDVVLVDCVIAEPSSN